MILLVKLKSLITSLPLQQIKEVGMVAKQEHVPIATGSECACKHDIHANFISFRHTDFHYS